MEGVSDIAGIDAAMKLGANHPMGPLELGDFIGLDICLAIMDVLYKETGDSKYRACPLIRKMVRGGNLGAKSGKGFYVYNADRCLDAQGHPARRPSGYRQDHAGKGRGGRIQRAVLLHLRLGVCGDVRGHGRVQSP